MPLRRCLDAGQPDCKSWVTAPDSRCGPCRRRHKSQRNADSTVASVAVSRWREVHGDWCPGWKRDRHMATDLTAEHGSHAVGSRRVAGVLCRQCNSAKRDRG